MRTAVFFCYHSGLDPGGDCVCLDAAQKRRVIFQ